jgi:hypothetical protein
VSPRVLSLKGTSFGYVLALPTNIRLGWKKFARYKHSSLLQRFVNADKKGFITLGPGGLFFNCKPFQPSLIFACKTGAYKSGAPGVKVIKHFTSVIYNFS